MSPAISVGSVEVDVVPNAQGVRQRLQNQLLPAANSVGDEVGRVIGRYLTSHVASAFVQGIQNGGRQAQPQAARQGQSTGSTFARSFKTTLEAALARLPEVRLRADSSDAEREIYQIRAQMQALTTARIGIDIDAETANAAIGRLRERLARLSASDANVAVRVDAGAAAAQLAAFQGEVNRLDGQTARVDVDASTATANLNMLTTAALAFGPALIPVLPVIAAGLGAVAAAATAAGAGLGAVALVAVPAFKQIGGVLQAQKAAQDAASQSAAAGGQAAAQAASKQFQLAAAQQAVATAARNGARQVAQAQQAVSQARQQADQTAAQAAQRSQQAARAVQDAEKALATAQKDARQAQLDLTAAREAGARELKDLNNQLTDSVLSQRDAEIQLKEATAQRNAVLSDTKSSSLDRERALLQYDQAVQRLKEQKDQTQQLQKQTDAANKAGIKGTSAYRTAQDALAKAQAQVADKAQALKDAQAAQARTAQENAQQIGDAQQKIADAQENVAVAQQNAADSAASAQRQLQQAQMQTASGANQAVMAQDKYRQALAKLTPSARDTLNAFVNLRTAFGDWSRSLQPAVMPIFTRALQGMTGLLPKLTPFVLEAAGAIQTLMDKASGEVKKPFWQGFYKDLVGSVKPAIIGLGVAFGNIFKGMAGIIDAFLPHMDGISSRMQGITKRFADWGTSLKGSPAFESFLAYAAEMGPVVAETIGKIVGAIVSLLTDISPFSKTVLTVIGGLADGIKWVADNAPWAVQGIYAIVVAVGVWRLGMLAWQGAMWLATAAMEAFTLVSSFGPWGWVVLGVTAVVLAVLYAWKHFAWFRDAVRVIWDAIKAAALAVYDWFKGPFVDFFTKTIPHVFWLVIDWVKANWPYIVGALTGPIGFAVAMVIKHWDKVKAGLSAGWDWIKKWVLYPVRDFFTKTIPGWAIGLAKKVTGAWSDMGAGISRGWSWIKTHILSPVKTFFTSTVPGWGTSLKNKVVGAFVDAASGIKKAWDKIQDIARKPVAFVVNTVYNQGLRKVWNLVTDAFGGKHLDPMKFASGGIMPGYTPGRDVHLMPSVSGPVALSGGEAIMRPEWTRAVGAGYVNAMNSAARNGGVGGVRSMLGFKDGGIFSGIGDLIGSGWDKVKKGAKWLADTFGGAVKAGVTHVVNPLISKIPGGNIGFTGLLKDLMKAAVSHLLDAGKKGDKLSTPRVSYSPTKGVEQWRPVVLQSLREVGQPPGLAQSTLRRMQQESGGNPTIVNRWDSNWIAGHPSVGLMQVIGPTFRSYAGKYRSKGPFSYGVSVDPLANVYSSMRYALGAYGSLSRAYDRAGGYDSGGFLQPGMNLAFNGTGRPEPVLTTAQWNAIQGASVRGGDGASLGDLAVSVYVGDREITDIARAEVRTAQGELIQVLNAS